MFTASILVGVLSASVLASGENWNELVFFLSVIVFCVIS
jgi:hypothetical protein